jgi:lysophospholipase L1-like esterase
MTATGRRLLLAWIVALGTFASCLGLFELALRIVGFSFNSLPMVQFGWPDPVTLRNEFVPDRDLLWVPRDYQTRLEAARTDRPAVVFMGDSCTQYGRDADQTLELLHGTSLSSGLALGVGGWSSQQGVWQLERDVLPLRPKVVTIYYGWNDHWAAIGAQDKEAHPTRLSFFLSHHLRMAQFVNMAWAGFDQVVNHGTRRVDLADYHSNLAHMVAQLRQARVVPVLMTAASSHVRGHEPQYLTSRWLKNLPELVPLHTSYVDETRKVAAETGAALCDVVASLGPDPARATYFLEDGIHLTRQGDRRVAQLLANCIREAYSRAVERGQTER